MLTQDSLIASAVEVEETAVATRIGGPGIQGFLVRRPAIIALAGDRLKPLVKDTTFDAASSISARA